MKRFLAIDPGETVGWANGTATDDELKFDHYDNTKSKTFLLALLSNAKNYDYIIYEDYKIRPDRLHMHVNSNVPTLQVIGGIKLAAWEGQMRNGFPTPKIVRQEPKDKPTGVGAAQVYVPDMVPVIAEALTGKHDDGHYADGIIHAIVWYHKAKQTNVSL